MKQAILRHLTLAKSLEKPLREIVEGRIIPILRNELEYPWRTLYEADPLHDQAFAVAFSGGIDSTSALIILKKAGLNPLALTVDPGPRIIPEHVKDLIRRVVKKLGLKHAYIEIEDEEFRRVFKDGIAGRRHPCGSCHRQIERAALKEMERLGIPITAFGNLLPTGSHSINLPTEGRLKLNILAALAYSKIDSLMAASTVDYPEPRFIYGCPFLRALHKKHRGFRYISIQGVLRETRANILEPNQALKLLRASFCVDYIF